MTSLILVLNCGSSSIKYAVINTLTQQTIQSGIAERINQVDGQLSWTIPDQIKQQRALPHADYATAIEAISQIIEQSGAINHRLKAIGHRVVHGGEKFKESVLITSEVLQHLEECNHLAPLHNPANLAGIKAMLAIYPHLPQVAVFDTAFHQTLPDYAYLYALPYELYRQYGIRRYGFHGISYRYVLHEAIKRLELKLEKSALLIAHLGNGCSVSAILNGKSIDTSMGMTPLEGLIMGSRCGDLDPSLPGYLAELLNCSLADINELLNKQSGLLGISGLSMDMRTLREAADNGNQQAQLAIEMFCYRLAKYIAALAIPLGRIDGLVFTGGIGENATTVRAKVIQWLTLFGFKLDAVQNAQHGRANGGLITQSNSPKALVIATNEELLIAQDTERLGEYRHGG
ncbi:MAG: ackA [Gammaproteobacteria bacterium]|jgi:acetate kinase|nr:ackA [Gammaproteobacteria bacterium]